MNCKTGAYGANVSVREDCGHLQIHYNSCRNRCCPMCQTLPTEKWMDAQREDVLEAPYFHVVFTVPQELNPLIYCNQKLLYDALYHSVSSTINELAEDEKYLGAKVWCIYILHTWGSEMNFHPHIHVILLGGGLTTKNSGVIKVKSSFFLLKYYPNFSVENIWMNWKLYGEIRNFNSRKQWKILESLCLQRTDKYLLWKRLDFTL